jgi:putative transposase
MARKNRVWYPNAAYHITTRGNHRNDIFREDSDYEFYLGSIEESLYYFQNKYEIICYCLMTNHTHIQIQTTDIPVSDLMKRISCSYAKYFNEKYNYIGHLYQGRYGAELIETDEYYLDVSRYIHLNPVKAKMFNKPEEYKWSSYNMFIGIEKEKIVQPKSILLYFNEENRRQLYKEYVESGIKKIINEEESD